MNNMSKLEYRAIQALKYKSGQIDRRTFVRSLLATGVALPSALSLAGQAAAATPKSGGLYISPIHVRTKVACARSQSEYMRQASHASSRREKARSVAARTVTAVTKPATGVDS